MTASVRIGVLNDTSDEIGIENPENGDLADWLRREIDALRRAGRIAADVEIVHAYGLGLPSGTAEAVETAYAQLAERDVLMIVGPAGTDNALIAAPMAERFRIPTVHFSSAGRARGRYMFHHQIGSQEDEGLVIARHLKSLGVTRLGVIHDMSSIGARHLDALLQEAAIIGQQVVSSAGVSPLGDEVAASLERVLDAKPEGIVHLGLGTSAPGISAALDQAGWTGPRMMNSAGIRGYRGNFARECEGWTYIDVHSDGNRTLQALRHNMGLPPRQSLVAAIGHDLGRLVAEGLARARTLSREGVCLGLEQVRWLPAAEGEDGTLLGFGIRERAALHGRHLVVRQWLGGESVEMKAR